MAEYKQSPRWQFNLKMPLCAVAVMATWLAVQTTVRFGHRFLFEMLFVVVTPPIFAAMIYYGHGNVRAFAIGAVFPPFLACVMLSMMCSELIMIGPYIIQADYPIPDERMHTARGSVVWLPASLICGLATMVVRALLSDSIPDSARAGRFTR